MKPEIYKDEGYKFMAAAFEVSNDPGNMEAIHSVRIHLSRPRANPFRSFPSGLAFISADERFLFPRRQIPVAART